MKDCPEFKLANAYNLGQAMYAGDDREKKPNFSFPIMHEEELPDDEVRPHGVRAIQGLDCVFEGLSSLLVTRFSCWW